MKKYMNTILVILITLITVIVLANIKSSAIASSKNNLPEQTDRAEKAFNNNSSDITGGFVFDY